MLFSAGVTALLALAVPGRCSGSNPFPAPGDASYEYIVVGGGTAGLTVAARLAAAGKSVAVVEAGGWATEMGNLTTIPGYAFSNPVLAPVEFFPPIPLLDWELLSQPQTGANNRKVHYAAGKTLGGSSAVNTMAYHRATRGTHQRWADIASHPSYTWNNMLPFFKKSSKLTPPDWIKRATLNASFIFDPTMFCLGDPSCGPLQVSYSNWVDPTNTWFAVALKAIGLGPSLLGFNSGFLSGGAYTTETIDPDSATRSSSQTSYLTWALQNTQLKVYNRTLASKILFNTNKKATGVTVSTAGSPTPYTLTATKEVILSAGTFHSPQLLMLSGIGPSPLLTSLNIPILSALPGVGQNLQDPIFFSVQHGVTTPSLASELADPNRTGPNLAAYQNHKSGPYSSAGGYIAFEKLPASLRNALSPRTRSLLASLPNDVPEVEYLAGSFAGTGNGITTIGDLSAAILNPFSRGSVTISSANISDPPVIDMGWLTDAADQEIAVAAFKRLRQAWGSPVLKRWKVGGEVNPGDGVETDEEILEWVKGNAIQIWHASRTCAMGKDKEKGAVVDWAGRVFGVGGLRVVDASALPFAMPGHPQATVYALAEKVAGDILGGN